MMNPSNDQTEKMQLRQSYRNVWHTELLHTFQVDTTYCCFAALCPSCVSYLIRKRALCDDMSRYVCCAGYMPCSGRCAEHKAPELCLAIEACCCFGSSVSSTRWLIQDEFNIQTTKCDNCIIAFMICINQVACIFSIIACILGSDELRDAAEILKCIANLVYCTVCACMQTQHKIELDKRDGKLGTTSAMSVPPVQTMSRLDQPYPPTVGYPQDRRHPPPPSAGGYFPPPNPDQPYPPTTGYPAHYHPDPQQYQPSAGYPYYPNHPYPPPPTMYQPYGYPSQYPPYQVYSPATYPPAPYPTYGYPEQNAYPRPANQASTKQLQNTTANTSANSTASIPADQEH